MCVFVDKANKYIDDVLSGKITVCDEVKQACKRQFDDLARQNTPDFPFVFNDERADKPCRFISLFCHVKGVWKGQKIVLEPFQCFIITTIYGWHYADNPNKRRFNSAYCELPRKQGKSLLAGGIALYALLGDTLEPTPEIYLGATSLEQAGEVFNPCRDMLNANPDIKKFFKVDCYAKTIVSKKTGGKITAVIGEGKDGKSPSLFVLDEFHQAKTANLLRSFTTGLGARPSGFGFIITTAGTDITSPCKEKHDYIKQILSGAVTNEREFGIIYTIPQGMDWKDYDSWKYANPNYGVSVMEDFLKSQYLIATQRASEQNDILTKNLNVWCSVNNAWMNMAKLALCADSNLKPDDLKGKECVIGLDLAEKIDLTASVLCFYDDTDVWVFPKFYLPSETMERDPRDIYRTWARMGLLTLCPGEVVDLEFVRKDLDEWREKYEANTIAYDPWHAQQFVLSLVNDAYECIEVKPNIAIMSEAMKQCEADIYSGSFHYDGNQMLTWNFSNVVGHYDAKGNIFPRKERNQNKIDGVMAVFTAYDTVMRMRNRESEGGVFFI